MNIIKQETSEKVDEKKEAEEKYRGFVNNISDIIYELDINGKCSYVSHQLLSISGFSSEEMIGQNVFNFVHPDDLIKVAEEVKIAFNSDDNRYIEFGLRHKDGYYVPISSRFSSITIGEKQKLTGVLVDITERKKAEQKLKESEEMFRNLTEQTFMGIAIVQDDVISYANQAILDIFGYSLDEVKSWKPLELLKLFPSNDREFILGQQRKQQDGYNRSIHNYKVQFFKKNGELGWLDLFSNPINYKGRLGIMVSMIDITDRMKAENLIIEENKKLLELDEMRKEMITRISHELKTPLTSIYGTIQLLLEDSKEKSSDSIHLEMLELANRGAIRLKKLIENLLDASLLDSQKIELNIQREDIGEIVELCIHENMNFADNRKLTIISELPNGIFLDVDKLRLGQAIINLISNAVKNTPRYGEIFVNIITHHKYIDFGKIERYGLDMDVDIEGSGLGLYISKEIVELHGGKILVESKGRDKGSQFTIRLVKKD
jgi:PAS domain S-box-containing protein